VFYSMTAYVQEPSADIAAVAEFAPSSSDVNGLAAVAGADFHQLQTVPGRAPQFLRVEQMKHAVSIDTITSTENNEHFF